LTTSRKEKETMTNDPITKQAEAVRAGMQFTAKDVTQILGITPANFQNWAGRGIVSCRRPKPGKGNRRLFGYAELKHMAVIGALHAAGFEPRTALEVAALVESCIGQPQRFLTITKDGERFMEQGAVDERAFVVDLFARGARSVHVVDMTAVNRSIEPVRRAALARVARANAGVGELVG